MTTRREFLKGTAAILGSAWGGSYAIPAESGPFDAEREEIGRPLSPWRPGTMEFHHIYTGNAESIFHIFPDGTTMLIDAGQVHRVNYELKCETLPDDRRGSGEYIARYIRRVNPHGNEVDYMMVSHFHTDHMGCCLVNRGRTEGRGEDYLLSGMTEVGESIHFRKGFDRGFPDYRRPFPIESPDVENYRRFLRWKMKEDGLEMEPFDVGRLDQITLRHEPEPFRDTFHIRNLCGNGVVWTGNEGEVNDLFYRFLEAAPSDHENPLSLGMRIDYGPFRYYTAGDFNESFTDPDGNEVYLEALVAPACGRVDVCKSNHHSSPGSMIPEFVAALQPRVFVTDIWDRFDICASTLRTMTDRRLYPGDRVVCMTNFPAVKKEEFACAPWRGDVSNDEGHVVIRVGDGGTRFSVYYLTARDESMTVKSIYGPFETSPKEESAA